MPEPRDELTGYAPPLEDIILALEVAGLSELLELEHFSHLDSQTVEVVLGEFGRFAADVIAPTDRAGDRIGARFDPATGSVLAPPEFRDAYERYVKSGWGALPFPEPRGGGGFPSAVGLALQEMFASANMALSLNPVLTQGSIEMLLTWGTEPQRDTYLAKLLTGEWSGTMALTEPDAGSDLGELRTRAEQGENGRWRVTGTKIFITWGEHDLASNVVHLVLARRVGAPAGSRGLSVFLVPKFLPDADGEPGEANSLRCVGIEDKLGIHGSPTCVMEFDGAVGELVGELDGGMRAMFTMMNAARLSIGVEGPAVGERAFQHACAYAAGRFQGRAPGVEPPKRSAIVEHPDVRRMLLEMRCRVLASRLVLFRAAACVDRARYGANEEERQRSQRLADLLTPVAKAWSTDAGVLVASLGIQVLGGAGFVEESGMAQRFRDARIAPIYEGTNGIQAIDLVTRKLGRDGGETMRTLLVEIAETAREVRESADERIAEGLDQAAEILAEAHETLERATAWLSTRLGDGSSAGLDDALAGATTYLELAGITIGAWLLTRRACRAVVRTDRPDAGATEIAEANYFATEIGARASGLLRPVTSGAGRLGALSAVLERIVPPS